MVRTPMMDFLGDELYVALINLLKMVHVFNRFDLRFRPFFYLIYYWCLQTLSHKTIGELVGCSRNTVYVLYVPGSIKRRKSD